MVVWKLLNYRKLSSLQIDFNHVLQLNSVLCHSLNRLGSTVFRNSVCLAACIRTENQPPSLPPARSFGAAVRDDSMTFVSGKELASSLRHVDCTPSSQLGITTGAVGVDATNRQMAEQKPKEVPPSSDVEALSVICGCGWLLIWRRPKQRAKHIHRGRLRQRGAARCSVATHWKC